MAFFASFCQSFFCSIKRLFSAFYITLIFRTSERSKNDWFLHLEIVELRNTSLLNSYSRVALLQKFSILKKSFNSILSNSHLIWFSSLLILFLFNLKIMKILMSPSASILSPLEERMSHSSFKIDLFWNSLNSIFYYYYFKLIQS